MLTDHVPIDTTALPWMPLGPGIAARILRLVGDERSLQLRVEPGVTIPLHRHDGDVHAFNVSGKRRLADGAVVGPGGYVYEPPGSIDWWSCQGDEPCVVQISMRGRLTYLNPDGSDGAYTDTPELRRLYRAWCAQNGHQPVAIDGDAAEEDSHD